MSRPIVSTIKKLLRLARGAPNRAEAQLAQSRADELIAKYRVKNIELLDDYKKRVEGVTGVFWREVLLSSVAPFFSVELRTATDRAAVLVGDEVATVEAAYSAYKHLEFSLITRCDVQWKIALEGMRRTRAYDRQGSLRAQDEHAAQIRDAMGMFDFMIGDRLYEGMREALEKRFGPAPEVPPADLSPEEEEKSERVWQRLYLDTGALAFGDALRKLMARKPKYEAGPRGQARQDREAKGIAFDLSVVMGITNKDAATRLADAARNTAAGVGEEILRQFVARSRRQIAVASSWLPALPLPIRPLPVYGLNRGTVFFDDDLDDDPRVEDDGRPESQAVANAIRPTPAASAPTPPAEEKTKEQDRTRFELLEID